ncbi:hypothetical protein ACIBTZ_15135 [Micromonospora sp. NPDC049460]|uniref:hypothetical protein n=1 Tax=Micromonospora sp. NPDC049460 TaxID=3364272 RepID=UPI003792DFA0
MLLAESPKVTDWMQAWGSIASLVMSTLAVLFTALLLRHERRVRREEQEDAQAAQARLIITRLEKVARDPETKEVSFEWTVLNRSQGPIFDPTVDIEPPRGFNSTAFVGEVEMPANSQTLLPGGSIKGKWIFTQTVNPRFFMNIKSQLSNFGISVRFTDASGLRWIRVKERQPLRSPIWVRQESIPHLIAELLGLPSWIQDPGWALSRMTEGLRRILLRTLEKKGRNQRRSRIKWSRNLFFSRGRWRRRGESA